MVTNLVRRSLEHWTSPSSGGSWRLDSIKWRQRNNQDDQMPPHSNSGQLPAGDHVGGREQRRP